MQSASIPANQLNVLGRRRDWIPGKLAVWAFMLGFWNIWPINHLIWEIKQK